MKTKRLISLLLAAVFALSAAATPALAASAGSELPDLTTAGVDENNSVVSIRLTADGDLTYGSPFTLSVQTTPADTQYIGVVMGTSGEAQGYVTLILSGKIRTLLKMIPCRKRCRRTLSRKRSSTSTPTSSTQLCDHTVLEGCISLFVHARSREIEITSSNNVFRSAGAA